MFLVAKFAAMMTFLYDCETSAQVWQSCADVKIVAAL